MSWPTDLRFRTFAAKLSDACMRATNRGFVITAGKKARASFVVDVCCPLGAYTGLGGHPGYMFFVTDTNISANSASIFIRGFDGLASGLDGGSPYWFLGVAYAKRYP